MEEEPSVFDNADKWVLTPLLKWGSPVKEFGKAHGGQMWGCTVSEEHRVSAAVELSS